MATTMSFSSAQARGDPGAGAGRESWGMPGLGPLASPLLACRRGHGAEGGLSAQGELAPHGAAAAGGATGLPGEGGALHTLPVRPPWHPLVLPMVRVVLGHSTCQDVGAGSLDAWVPPPVLTPACALPAGCLPHHQPAALLQAGKGGPQVGPCVQPWLCLAPCRGTGVLSSTLHPTPSNSSMPAQPRHWPSCPCTAVVPTAKPVPNAA